MSSSQSRNRRNIGEAAIEALLSGKSNEEALAAVRAEFPRANTTLQSIAWYRNDLRKKGHNLPTSREAQRRRETPAPMDDLTLMHKALETLRAGGEAAQRMRAAIGGALTECEGRSAIGVFASDLPDEAFDGVFPGKRESDWREIDL